MMKRKTVDFRMIIDIDRNTLENEGYNFDYTLELLKENFKTLGFERESLDDGTMVFVGIGSNKDYAYMSVIAGELAKQSWFKNSVQYWHLFNNELDMGNYISYFKERGIW